MPPRRKPVEVRNDPEQILAEYRKQKPSAIFLSEVLPGPQNAGLRVKVAQDGVLRSASGRMETRVVTKKIDGTDEYEVLHTAAIARDPGLSTDLIQEIQDFTTPNSQGKAQRVEQYWRIYNTEGIINNTIEKLAALLAGGGRFKVRKARKGKKQKAQEQLQLILDEFVKNVNNAPLDGVVTGARGLKAVTQQAVRQALVEGDWIGRTVWTEHQVGTEGTFSLPMTIQSITTAQVEPVEELIGMGIEAFYWVPPSSVLQQVENPKDKNVKQLLKKYFPKDVISQLKKDRKYFLDPALLLHVKHSGVDFQPFGVSLIEPALLSIAYKRAVESLDIVTIKNLINRMVIVKVGTSDPNSPYRDAQVQLVRAQLMQSLLEDPGPNMLMVWQGDDVDTVEVSAHNSIEDLDERHRLGDQKIIRATGIPTAILDGTNDGSKASGMASMLGIAARLDGLQSSMEQIWTTLGERIATENGFDQFEVIFEFDNSLQLDRMEEWNQRRLDYQTGALTIYDYLLALGYDPDAVYLRKCFEKGMEPGSTTWEQVFAPLAGLPGQGKVGPDGKAVPPGAGPGKPIGDGRTPNNVTGNPNPDRPAETNSPEEQS